MSDRAKDARDEPGDLRLRWSHDPQDYARSHPLRLAILALLARRRHSECPVADLSAQLPGFPDLAVVKYHLRVLRQVGLVSEREADTTAVYSLV